MTLRDIDRLLVATVTALLVLILMTTGCGQQIVRAEARLIEAQAEVLRECRRMMQLQQAGPCPIAVTIVITRKYGEKPTMQLMPPIPFLATFSAVLGETP